jgi:glutathione synthase/RimK-type ligase-like ATP-grasp enzyme
MKKLLIITTEADISLSLFLGTKIKKMIDINVIYYDSDFKKIVNKIKNYDFVYLRDPFNNKKLSSVEIRKKLSIILKSVNKSYFVDNIKNVKAVFFEDKWLQYCEFKEFMPKTILIKDFSKKNNNFIFKKRISSRAKDIFFDYSKIKNKKGFIAQKKLLIEKEYRVFSLFNNILPIAGVKSSKTESQKVKIIGYKKIPKELLLFVEKIDEKMNFDFVGYDIAQTKDNKYYLIEINRSPQFSAYQKKTKNNLAEKLVVGLLKK